jgi:hypothetical protein
MRLGIRRFGYDTEPEVTMPQNDRYDCDVEFLIKLLYVISDALRICEAGSAGGLDSPLGLRELLCDAKSHATVMLSRASERQLRTSNGATVACDENEKLPVFVYN